MRPDSMRPVRDYKRSHFVILVVSDWALVAVDVDRHPDMNGVPLVVGSRQFVMPEGDPIRRSNPLSSGESDRETTDHWSRDRSRRCCQ